MSVYRPGDRVTTLALAALLLLYGVHGYSIGQDHPSVNDPYKTKIVGCGPHALARLLRVFEQPTLSTETVAALKSHFDDTYIDDGGPSTVAYLCEIDIAGSGAVNAVHTTFLPTMYNGRQIARDFGTYWRLQQEIETAVRHWEFRKPTDDDYCGPVNMARIDEITATHPDVGVNNIAKSSVTVSTILVVVEIGADGLRFPYEYVGAKTSLSVNGPRSNVPSEARRYQRLLRSGNDIHVPDSLGRRLLRERKRSADPSFLRYALWRVEASISRSGSVHKLRTTPIVSDGENVFDSAYSVALNDVGTLIEKDVKQWMFIRVRDPDYDGPIRPQILRQGSIGYLSLLLSKDIPPYTMEFFVYLPLSSRMPDSIEYLAVRQQ